MEVYIYYYRFHINYNSFHFKNQEQNAFIISIYNQFPDLPTRCFMQVFGIGSNRLANFIKKRVLLRRKPGGLNGKEVTKEMKKNICDYVNSLRMEEVAWGNTTCLKLLDVTNLATLHAGYKAYYEEKDPRVRIIEKYKTFYEHFNRLFPDVQLSKGPAQKKYKSKTTSAFEIDEVD